MDQNKKLQLGKEAESEKLEVDVQKQSFLNDVTP